MEVDDLRSYLFKRAESVYVMKKASDLFVEALESEGVEFIFGIPSRAQTSS